MMLDKLGQGIILRETIALHSVFVCLVMPVAGYLFFGGNNALSRLWVKAMPVSQSIYFGYALPAISGFVLTLCWPMSDKNITDKGDFIKRKLTEAKIGLQTQKYSGIYLMTIGTIMFTISAYLPAAFQFVSILLYFAAFAGFLYVYYTPKFRLKIFFLLFFSFIILVNAISSGMFTVVAYMGLTLFSFFFLGHEIRFWKKVLIFFAGISFLIVLQLAKPEYRKITWKENYSGDKASLLLNLMEKQVSNLNWNSVDAFFPIYVRANQGFNVALVMKRIPKVRDYDYGSQLSISFASAWIPRLFWPNKPEAGGKFNMEFYTGYKIKGWSTNIGPLGEAYGSFGTTGGIIFMVFLGFLIRRAYLMIFIVSNRIPLIIFWIPVIFYQVTYSAETDTLQIVNSLIKSAFFIWMLYKLVPKLFGR
ncbi:MAG: hypothetical protein KF746_21960 [Chitinophagaceae bacterium]|nr:hypothetical protein [Chitinophagaceae bacterium]